MRRGEIWWAELPAPVGRRPVVLLSRNEAYAVRELVVVAPITSRIRRTPTEVALGRADGLPRRCVENLDSVTTIPKRALTQRLASLAPEKLAALERAHCFAVGIV
jgi:mRNA interferase MazF